MGESIRKRKKFYMDHQRSKSQKNIERKYRAEKRFYDSIGTKSDMAEITENTPKKRTSTNF